MSRRGYCRIVRLQNKLEIRVPSMVNHPDDHLSVPEETAVQEFVASFWGELIRPVDDGYDAARAVYNGMIDKRPALIVRPTGTADVIDAVNLARENSLLLAVRCGGHSVAGNSVVDGGITDRPPQPEGRASGPRVAHGTCQRRCGVGRVRPGDPAFWARDSRWPGDDYRRRRLHARRRLRLALAEVGAGVRQPDLGRRRDRRWQAGNGKRGGERRPLLGHPRRQRQLRGGEFLRVPPPPFGSDRAGRLGPPPDR